MRSPPAAGGSGGKLPDIPTWAIRDYGNRIGIFRLMETLDRYGIRATAALNSSICLQHPIIIEEGQKRGWEWMGHNETNTKRLNEVPADEEPKVISRTLTAIASATGVKPIGWLGSGLQETWNTLEYLAAEGCQYVCDWTNDDQPYVMMVGNGQHLVSIPYSMDINDKAAYEKFNRTPAEFQEMICRQFDVLYREGEASGRVMAICLHPYLTGQPYRIGALDAALEYICQQPDVWLATGGEIAREYLGQAGK